jgi:CheY-like chemotaxis protein
MKINRVVLFCILQKLGYDADLATNGQEALKATQVNATNGRNEVNRKNPRISCAHVYVPKLTTM